MRSMHTVMWYQPDLFSRKVVHAANTKEALLTSPVCQAVERRRVVTRMWWSPDLIGSLTYIAPCVIASG